ncbi:MAG: hypothetical protein KME29_15515 [Calothrix sp. FI2-JRJ7]|jgi:hypothetical protein|nr:hypothetical protein [Calothrix sp. FI2-JRJ7]
MSNNERQLTPKEEIVVNAFEETRAGLGAVAERNIRNEDTGWSKIIESTPEEELTKTEERTSRNSFCYRRIGG